jgi:magnesium-transporting ATPase (P-type)
VLLQTLVTAQWVYMINCRDSDNFSLNRGLLQNKGIWIVTVVLFALQAIIIYVPLMNTLFGTRPLPFIYWVIGLLIGIALFVIVEIEKVLTRSWRKAG